LSFCDQVAYSHQIQELMQQTNHNDWHNKSTDLAPDTKFAEQSKENILRLESFKKRKEKVTGERQKICNTWSATETKFVYPILSLNL